MTSLAILAAALAATLAPGGVAEPLVAHRPDPGVDDDEDDDEERPIGDPDEDDDDEDDEDDDEEEPLRVSG